MELLRVVLLIFGLTADLTIAAGTSCFCEKSFKPVCGTDDVTYENICQLECKSTLGVKLAYVGTCCPKNVCPPHRNPICDNFGRTYANECVFFRVQCLARKRSGRLLSKVHDGECSSDERNSGEDCNADCVYSGKPVCDENGITHEDECRFERLNCLLRKSGQPEVLLQHYGECNPEESATTPSGDLSSSEEGSGFESSSKDIASGVEKDVELLNLATKEPLIVASGDHELPQEAENKRDVKARAIPTLFLDEVDEFSQTGSEPQEQGDAQVGSIERDLPVIPGTNEEPVYPLSSDELLLKIRAPIESEEDELTAKSPESSIPPAISVSAILQPFDLTQPCSAAECDKTRNPVCDSNNRTHKNLCLFKFYACKVHRLDGTVVELSHMGECAADAKTINSICPPCPVTQSDTLVCDNLNKTHESLCALARFNCIQRVFNEDERVLIHIGRCHSRSLSFTLKNEKCPTRCSSDSRPVCDTQGTTHLNLCEFQKVNCQIRKKGRQAPMLFDLRPCGDSFNKSNAALHSKEERISKEPSSTLVSVKSSAEVQQSSTPQRMQFDCPPPVCTLEGLPVCDSQGIMHENVCLFLHARCLSAREGITLSTQPEENCLRTLCDKECPPNEKPVCGSNFITYTNLCHFNKKRCRDETLSVLFYGKCEECLPTPCTPVPADSPDDIYICDNEGFTRTLCEYRMLSCIVEKSLGVNLTVQHKGRCCEPDVSCDIEPMSEICGSDGKTYRNNCSLAVENCRNRKLQIQEIKIVHQGRCDEMMMTREAKEALVALEELVQKESITTTAPTTLRCPTSCDNIYAPVCGSNDVTYTNLCHLKSAQCRSDNTLGLAYNGECCSMDCPSNFNPVCDDQGITHQNLCFFGRERCIIERITGRNITIQKFDVCGASTCDKECPKTYKPICVSNGETLVNECHLDNLNCFLTRRISSTSLITKLYDGECCSNENCGYEFSPVCDSLGETHTNECVFKRKACLQRKQNNINITIQYKGQCCNRECDPVRAPVCDGSRTHNNMCKFKIAQCEAERQGHVLTLAHVGECCTLPKGKCEESGTVCDSDGQTHNDVCHFQQKRCVINKTVKKTLTVVHSGECCTIEACHKGTSAPVCDTHGGTHATKCHFQNTKCIHDKMHPNNPINLAYSGTCCSNNCANVPDEPVCDQHGNMYRNRCEFKYRACERRKRSNSVLLETPCPERRLARRTVEMSS